MIKCTNYRKEKYAMNPDKTIKEWQLEKGITLVDTKGFPFSKNLVHSKKFSDKSFRKYAQRCTVKCKTEKGYNFLNK